MENYMKKLDILMIKDLNASYSDIPAAKSP
jgi:hypothetical protein